MQKGYSKEKALAIYDKVQIQLKRELKKKILTGQLITDEYIDQKETEFTQKLEAEWRTKES